MEVIIDKNFDQLIELCNDPDELNSVIAKYGVFDLMRLTGMKKVTLIDIDSNTIVLKYKIDSQYHYNLIFTESGNGKINFDIQNAGSSLGSFGIEKTKRGVLQRLEAYL